MICAPCLRRFLRGRRIWQVFRLFTSSSILILLRFFRPQEAIPIIVYNILSDKKYQEKIRGGILRKSFGLWADRRALKAALVLITNTYANNPAD
jgi:hypothetical protein